MSRARNWYKSGLHSVQNVVCLAPRLSQFYRSKRTYCGFKKIKMYNSLCFPSILLHNSSCLCTYEHLKPFYLIQRSVKMAWRKQKPLCVRTVMEQFRFQGPLTWRTKSVNLSDFNLFIIIIFLSAGTHFYFSFTTHRAVSSTHHHDYTRRSQSWQHDGRYGASINREEKQY